MSLRDKIFVAVAAALSALVIVALAAWALWPVPSIEVDGGSRIVLEVDRDGLRQQDVPSREAIDQSIWIMAKRLDELAVANGKVRRDGEDRVLIDLAGAANPSEAEKLARIIGKAGKFEFRLVDTTVSPDDARRGRTPSDDDLLYEMGAQKRLMLVRKQAMVDGAEISDAHASFDQRTGEPVVTFKFTSDGARKFGRATQENVGRPFAMVFDNEVISAPVIREPILSGYGQISGNFTVESANNMAILLRLGALPVKFKLVEIRQEPPAPARR
jgi:preprotein translocase subunit SecD